jgi:hypothetical protein
MPRGQYTGIGRYERSPETRARISESGRRVNVGLRAKRLGVVFNALPGTLLELADRTGFSHKTLRTYLRALEAQGVMRQRNISNRRGFGYAIYYEETEIEKGT